VVTGKYDGMTRNMLKIIRALLTHENLEESPHDNFQIIIKWLGQRRILIILGPRELHSLYTLHMVQKLCGPFQENKERLQNLEITHYQS
jgi:hypothetical protein